MKIRIFACLCACALPVAASPEEQLTKRNSDGVAEAASPVRPKTEQKPGRVVAAQVSGQVEAAETGGGAVRRLKARDVFGENTEVSSAADSSATLVFSNGATISIGQKSKLVISEFLQDPFSTPFSMPIEEAESSVSTTKLNLKEGEVTAKVKKLKAKEGSTLTIETPVGAAGIRGTTFAISYVPSPDGSGQGTYTLSVTEGAVSFTDVNGNQTLVTAGRELSITFNSTTDPVTGEVTVTEILGSEVRNIAPNRLAAINQAAENGEVVADTIIFDGGADQLLVIPQLVDGLGAAEVMAVDPPKPVTKVNP